MAAAVLSRPEALAADFSIQTIDDVDAALHELGWCQRRAEAIDADTKTKIEALKTSQDKLKVLKIGDDPDADDPAAGETTLEKRAELLEAALLKWGQKHLAKHLPKDSKTLQLAHGELAFKQQPLAVSLADGVKEKAVYAAIDKKTKFVTLATNLLTKIALGAFHLGQIISLKPDLDKNAIKQAWDQNPKSRGTLRGLGITVTGGEDAVVVTPAKVKVSKAA